MATDVKLTVELTDEVRAKVEDSMKQATDKMKADLESDINKIDTAIKQAENDLRQATSRVKEIRDLHTSLQAKFDAL